ncbi:MAG TPA: hypothetical protein P5531_03755 [Bacteroidales bacterium]|nr:hypothetical protein [Bacteroidales bacterium]
MVVLKKKLKRIVWEMVSLRAGVMYRMGIRDKRTLEAALYRNDPRLVEDKMLEYIERETGIPTMLMVETAKKTENVC